ncbi:MAG TPA: carboxypeptidase-like regulatory domain-containing protein [Candidatus Eremiobacteraceae bacterium]|nr:carboxypeptidase-like regulatory domain-containing protein [Candidatus Eremiobacteraceae bacterium]
MKRLFFGLLLTLSFVVSANSQTFRGAINGTVTDPSGAAVPNATVKATESATGLDHTTVTSGEGLFSIQDIPLGFYKVTVSASGFPTTSFDKVEVVAGTIYTLNVQLKLGQSSTTVEVSAASITMDTTTSAQTMSIQDDVVQNAPLNGRDFTQLIAVQPGFGGYNVGGFGSLNGTRPNQINWQIDGVDNNDFWHNIPAVNQGGVSGIAGVVLPMDSIVEFSSQTQAGPESGRNAGGTVNVVTRSGTNAYHGTIYYYNRNEFYAAHTPFLPLGTKAPPLRNENYGASVGGPILKDKLFFFANFEKQDFTIGLSGIATEPSDAWVGLAQDLLANPGNKYGAYAPVAASPASANAIGPTGFWPRSGKGSIAALPLALNNFFAPIAETGHSFNGVARLDYVISNNQHLYLRAYMGQGNQTAPLGGSPALGTASSNLQDYFEVAPLHVGNYSAVLNSTFSSRLTNQLLFGANYFNQIFNDFNNSFNTKNMGINLSPDAVNKGQYINGAPNIVIGQNGGIFEQIGLTPPEGRSDLTWHINDVVSHNIGNHSLRYGGEIRQAHLNEFYHRRGTGKFTFAGDVGPWAGATGCGAAAPTAACTALQNAANNQNLLPGALALADFLAGFVSNNISDAGSTIAVGDPERWVVVNAFNLNFQDTWQTTKRLSLTFGLRYEYFGPMHSQHADIANFVPGTGLVALPSGKGVFESDHNNFAPRFGFAYQANQKGDLVIRGGVGVFYDQINLNPFLDFRPPVAAPQGIEGNAFGSTPVTTYNAPFCGTLLGLANSPRTGSYQWDAVQAGTCPAGYSNAGAANAGAAIFGPALACSDPNCGAAGDPAGVGVYSVSKNFRTPYFYNYNLQIEKGLGNTGVFQIGYVGSQGRKLNIVRNINQNGDFPNFGAILELNTIGTSNYNALQAQFRSRNWHGLTSQVAYTWSHSLDEISEYRAAILDDAFNKRLDYGNGDFDTRHLFTLSFNYEVPKAKWATSTWSKLIFNDWQVSSIMNFHSGQPYDELLSGLNFLGGSATTGSNKFDQSIPGLQWLNPAAFCDPKDAGCGGGPVSRNKFPGPNFKDVDLSVIKNIHMTERFRLELRADMFNMFNRTNFASGVGSVGLGCNEDTVAHHCGSGFGTVTDTIGDFNGAPGLGPGEQFNMQLAVKLHF